MLADLERITSMPFREPASRRRAESKSQSPLKRIQQELDKENMASSVTTTATGRPIIIGGKGGGRQQQQSQQVCVLFVELKLQNANPKTNEFPHFPTLILLLPSNSTSQCQVCHLAQNLHISGFSQPMPSHFWIFILIKAYFSHFPTFSSAGSTH